MSAIVTELPGFFIRHAVPDDVPLILEFIHKLAAYEKLTHEVEAGEQMLRERLFGPRPYAEVILGEHEGRAVGFALFFHNFSTFVGKPGLYLEDLFVDPEYRGRAFGKTMMVYLAKLARQRDCGRFEWSVLNWNQPSIDFYRSLGAEPMEEWTIFRLSGDNLARLGE